MQLQVYVFTEHKEIQENSDNTEESMSGQSCH